MSEENVEIVKSIFKAWEERDAEAAFRHIHPNVEVDVTTSRLWGNSEIDHGHDALQRAIGHLFEVWEDLEFAPETFIEAGNEVVVYVRITARGRGSGVPTERHGASVYTVRDGMVTRWRGYESLSDAVAAVGL
jgi:ketosteroid isomerase-like protein